MLSKKRQFGDRGEEIAVNFLKAKGYKILDRNYRQPWGEIDIIATKTKGFLGRKTETIFFVEVKTIKGKEGKLASALAGGNVHYKKQQRLIRAAKTYLAQKRILPEICWQIDVIIVNLNTETNLAKIEHLANAVWGR